ncbi:hypothetical protein B0H16DRAFT_695140 [Mycena metata]|uniref:Uncharacterized protein n=1 Tax=Mycena metata TaxID=1033252 RepID=A0AAD7J6N9_9AGAR|nr:hypothetical protein B0H16DRAFT_695140 [Mycena metata]
MMTHQEKVQLPLFILTLRVMIHLPDEILSEILSPALKVSDEAFSTTHSYDVASPFMTFSESSSAFLLVCKAWLRVATPLLYNVVVIRSKAQAQTLAGTLKLNPALGGWVKKLRAEGGYAISMLKILQTCKNVTDVYLRVAILRSDNTCGLCRGLHLLNPLRIIIDYGDRYGGTFVCGKLVDALSECILATWKRLAVAAVSDSVRDEGIFNALALAPNLDTFLLLDMPYSQAPQTRTFLKVVAANPALKQIRVNPHKSRKVNASEPYKKSFYEEVKKDTELRALFDWTDKELLDPSPSLPFVYPARLAAAPVAEDAIWSRVLYFALCRDPSLPEWAFFPILSPLLVCKKFARLGVPHLYEDPLLKSRAGLYSFAAQLAAQPALGLRVRHLTINTRGDLSTFTAILAQTPGLTELRGTWNCQPITRQVFDALSESTAGSNLQSFGGIPLSKVHGMNPAVFALFPRMVEFGWDSVTTFKTAPALVPTNAFNLLVKLTVNAFETSFLNVLSQMDLPSLRIVVFAATAEAGVKDGPKFFEKHGPKLQEVTLSAAQIADSKLAIWRNCPAMTVLSVACDDKHPATKTCVETAEVHERLERIVFRLARDYRFMRSSHDTAMGRLLSALNLNCTTTFPALRELEHPWCKYPTNEGEILNDQWVRWAEMLFKRGVHLVGPQGVRWRPRLKFVPKTSTAATTTTTSPSSLTATPRHRPRIRQNPRPQGMNGLAA